MSLKRSVSFERFPTYCCFYKLFRSRKLDTSAVDSFMSVSITLKGQSIYNVDFI